MQALNTVLGETIVDISILRAATKGDLTMESEVFRDKGTLTQVMAEARKQWDEEASKSEDERRERSAKEGARCAHKRSATSAGDLAALAALAPSPD
jgi:hypothetical protein